MTERKLLELAARAAGKQIDIETFGEYQDAHNGCVVADGEHWNPLKCDGDALRLAVKLGINVNFGSPEDGAVITFDFTGRFKDCEEQGEPMPAARRAIVRAAAEIGSQMK